HHLPLQRYRSPLRGRGGRHHPSCPGDLLLRRTEALIHNRNLFWMDAQFPAEAQPARAQRISAQLLGIVDRGGDAVYRRLNTCQSRQQEQLRPEIEQLLLVSGYPDVDLKIERTENQPVDS